MPDLLLRGESLHKVSHTIFPVNGGRTTTRPTISTSNSEKTLLRKADFEHFYLMELLRRLRIKAYHVAAPSPTAV
jgi:hypothetical protein